MTAKHTHEATTNNDMKMESNRLYRKSYMSSRQVEEVHSGKMLVKAFHDDFLERKKQREYLLVMPGGR